MTATTDTYLLLRAFVDELCRCGMTDACTSPGSRSAPLVLTLAREPRLRAHSHIDERCAGFFALGLAKATGRPVAVACTSGTAAANLAPAVIEAHQARVPLIVLTADRPPELRDVGAGQTIDQLKLYGDAARWFVEVGTHDATAESWMRTLACRAYWTASGRRPGPVHLNFPLREPLIADGPLPDADGGRTDGGPRVSRVRPPEDPSVHRAVLASALADARRPVVVAGRYERDPALAPILAAFAEGAGAPLLADPLSGARRGAAAIAHYDLLLRRPESFDADLAIRVGDLPTSKPLRGWLAKLDGPQISIDPDGAWQDPSAVVGLSLDSQPAALLADPPGSRASADWLPAWRAADDRLATRLDELLGDELSEPAVARELSRTLPAGTTLFVSSSMPIRDVETFWVTRDDPPRVLSNRGANGIDGTVSSAFGAAVSGSTVLLIGDVALAHDIGGLLAASRLGVALAIVLLDNGGGAIFDFLAVAGETDVYEQHVATPTGLDFERAAALYGLAYARVETSGQLRAAIATALGGDVSSTLIHVRSDRAENLRLHRRIAAGL